jgi:hypothetical protein
MKIFMIIWVQEFFTVLLLWTYTHYFHTIFWFWCVVRVDSGPVSFTLGPLSDTNYNSPKNERKWQLRCLAEWFLSPSFNMKCASSAVSRFFVAVNFPTVLVRYNFYMTIMILLLVNCTGFHIKTISLK